MRLFSLLLLILIIVGYKTINKEFTMLDVLQNFRCKKCRHMIVDFDKPKGECESCSDLDSYAQCASEVVTRLATEGIFYEYTLDSSYTVDERNDKYTEELLQDQANNAYGDIRSGKVKFEQNIQEE